MEPPATAGKLRTQRTQRGRWPRRIAKSKNCQYCPENEKRNHNETTETTWFFSSFRGSVVVQFLVFLGGWGLCNPPGRWPQPKEVEQKVVKNAEFFRDLFQNLLFAILATFCSKKEPFTAHNKVNR